MAKDEMVKKLHEIFKGITKKEGEFSLILLKPIESQKWDGMLNLIISAKWLDDKSPRTGIKFIQNNLKTELNENIIQRIVVISIIHTSDQLVKNLTNMFQIAIKDKPTNIGYTDPSGNEVIDALLFVSQKNTTKQKSNLVKTEQKQRVFISHSVDDLAQIDLLRRKIKKTDQMEFEDYSIKASLDERWRAGLIERIKKSSVVIVAIGEKTHERETVDWEIRKAHELGKPVIGMMLHKDKKYKLPKAMVEYNDFVVPWDLENLRSYLFHSSGAVSITN